MSGYYTIVVEAWPYSTGSGQTADQAAAGPRVREFTDRYASFDAAHKAALTLQLGIKSSGHVYEAPIQSITYRGEMRP
jgi:hypothetical protein